MSTTAFYILLTLIIISLFASLYDDHKNKTGKLTLITVGYILLWPICFPYYLYKRKVFINKAQEAPVKYSKVKRVVCYTIISIYCFFLYGLFNMVWSLEDCDSGNAKVKLQKEFQRLDVYVTLSEFKTLNTNYHGIDPTIPRSANVCSTKATGLLGSHSKTFNYVIYMQGNKVVVKLI